MEENSNSVKIKSGNDPLGIAIKKEKKKEDKAQGPTADQQFKQQFTAENNLGVSPDSKPKQRTLTFKTQQAEVPTIKPKTIVFGKQSSDNNTNTNNNNSSNGNNNKSSQQYSNLFGVDPNKPKQQQQSNTNNNSLFGVDPNKNKQNNSSSKNLSKSDIKGSQVQQQQQKQNPLINNNQQNSNNNNNTNVVQKKSQNQSSSNNLNQKSNNFIQQQMPSTNNNFQEKTLKLNSISQEQYDTKVKDDRMKLLKMGVSKDDYMEGELYITHNEVDARVKLNEQFYDSKTDNYAFFRGKLILTSWMLRFIPSEDSRRQVASQVERHTFFNLPLGFVLKVSRTVDKKGINFSYLEILSKDNREYLFRFHQSHFVESSEFQTKIQRYAFPEDKNQLFAFQYAIYNKDLKKKKNGWNVFSWEKEFDRLGVEIAPFHVSCDTKNLKQYFEFRYIDNSNGQICNSYPDRLIVPFNMSDELIRRSAQFRSRERLPALSYAFKNNKVGSKNKYVSMWRCSQCKTGISNNRGFEDEKYFRIIGDQSDQSEKTGVYDYNCHIFDARPKLNAVSNQLAGKGFESTDFYKNCQLTFLNIGNIHKVRDAQKLVHKAINGDPYKYLGNFEKSGYLEIISYILEGALRMVQKLKTGMNIVLHCSDGWDRTSQLCSLVQIFMDPYFRTIEGFQVLIEKEWISYGHQFGIRCGHGNKKHDEEQRSPIFSQFLDSVYQVMQQFPLSFEFNSKYLMDINYHLYSCRFGTFLCNNFQEQKAYKVQEKTISLWTFLNQEEQVKKYTNPFLVDLEMGLHELEPDYRVVSLKLWKEFFLYHNQGFKDKYNMHMEVCNFNEDNVSIIHYNDKMQNEKLRELRTLADEDLKEKMDEYNAKLRSREAIIDKYIQKFGSLYDNEQKEKQQQQQPNDEQQQQDNSQNKNSNEKDENQNENENSLNEDIIVDSTSTNNLEVNSKQQELKSLNDEQIRKSFAEAEKEDESDNEDQVNNTDIINNNNNINNKSIQQNNNIVDVQNNQNENNGKNNNGVIDQNKQQQQEGEEKEEEDNQLQQVSKNTGSDGEEEYQPSLRNQN